MSRLHYLANQMKRNRYASGGRTRPYEPVWSTNQLSQMGQSAEPEGYSDLIEKYHTPGKIPYKYNAPLPPLSPSFEQQTKQGMKREANTIGEQNIMNSQAYSSTMNNLLNDIRACNPELADKMDLRYKPQAQNWRGHLGNIKANMDKGLTRAQQLSQQYVDQAKEEERAIAAKQIQEIESQLKDQLTDWQNQVKQKNIDYGALQSNYNNTKNLLGTTQKDLENQKLEVQRLQALPKVDPNLKYTQAQYQSALDSVPSGYSALYQNKDAYYWAQEAARAWRDYGVLVKLNNSRM